MEQNDPGLEVIKKLLKQNEESYRPGAWEEFSGQLKKREKRVFRLWVYRITAAIIFIISGVFLMTDNLQRTMPAHPKKLVKRKYAQPASPVRVSIVEAPNHPSVLDKKNVDPIFVAIPEKEVIIASQPKTDTIVSAPITLKKESLAATKHEKNKRRIFPVDPWKNSPPDLEKEDNKWTIGIDLSGDHHPAKKLNFGLGTSIAYALTDKISITSGAGFRHLGGAKTFEAQGAAASSIGKSLESVKSRLSGIDVPLAITYHLKKQAFVSLGVSAFAVLKESGERSYINSTAHENSYIDEAGVLRHEFIILQERLIEPFENTSGKSAAYLGFFNLSFGYREKISKGMGMTIEPFLKLPMKASSQDAVSLSAAGIKLGIIL